MEREDKEPTAQQAASRLGARLDPVHPASNQDAFASQNSPESTAISMPEELVDLSQMAVALANAKNLGERVAKAAQVSGIIGVRRAGYNPMLSKYEQRMPKAAALYLARGRGGLAPYAGEKFATSRARKVRSELSDLTEEAPADHAANIADEIQAMVRPALLRLAKHKERRCEFKSIPWVLRDQLRLPRTSRNFQIDNAAGICIFISAIFNCFPHFVVCCSVVQCGAVWCSVLQCVAVCCIALQCDTACCSVLQCVAVCSSVLQLQCGSICCNVLRFFAVLQCVAAQCAHRSIRVCVCV